MFSQTQPPLGLSALLIAHMVNSKSRRFSAKNVKPSSFKPFSPPSSSIAPPRLTISYAKIPTAISTPSPLKTITPKDSRVRMRMPPGADKKNGFLKIMRVLESKAADDFDFGNDFRGAKCWVWLGFP